MFFFSRFERCFAVKSEPSINSNLKFLTESFLFNNLYNEKL